MKTRIIFLALCFVLINSEVHTQQDTSNFEPQFSARAYRTIWRHSILTPISSEHIFCLNETHSCEYSERVNVWKGYRNDGVLY